MFDERQSSSKFKYLGQRGIIITANIYMTPGPLVNLKIKVAQRKFINETHTKIRCSRQPLLKIEKNQSSSGYRQHNQRLPENQKRGSKIRNAGFQIVFSPYKYIKTRLISTIIKKYLIYLHSQ
ncbi:hypothetical protein FGO68_gene6472 [Halteria grandinella]|uniref:Uncharacterized protein n=1 Tax=Halteria grandinella TaxID=5974 RepID=A0A8J8T5D4_HALGN|nr:hypothetical protein FGO68_gene6472 [Halteria grandinella]